jgi:hypothetical protein
LVGGLVAVFLAIGAVFVWTSVDQYKTRAMAGAAYKHPQCQSIEVVRKDVTNSRIIYTIDSCGVVEEVTVKM